MERAFKLSEAHGGGSVTALPIIETQRGNISGFIPTNLISMTDGQIYLDATSSPKGQLPAVDVGLSVSRVGGERSARHRCATPRPTCAWSYRSTMEVKAFARFGTLLDEIDPTAAERAASGWSRSCSSANANRRRSPSRWPSCGR